MNAKVILALAASLALATACGSDKRSSKPTPKTPTTPLTPPSPVDPNSWPVNNTPGSPVGFIPGTPSTDLNNLVGKWTSQAPAGASGLAELTFKPNGQFELRRFTQQGQPPNEVRSGTYTASITGQHFFINLRQRPQSDKGKGDEQKSASSFRTVLCLSAVTETAEILQMQLNCAWGGGERPTSIDDFSDLFTRPKRQQ
jgi:hypothetical protein